LTLRNSGPAVITASSSGDRAGFLGPAARNAISAPSPCLSLLERSTSSFIPSSVQVTTLRGSDASDRQFGVHHAHAGADLCCDQHDDAGWMNHDAPATARGVDLSGIDRTFGFIWSALFGGLAAAVLALTFLASPATLARSF
jgi:hypothetical protein